MIATFCASRARRCWAHMSFTAASIRMEPSTRFCIFCMCRSLRLPSASRVPIRFWSCWLRAWSMQTSSSSPSRPPLRRRAPRPPSSVRMALAQVCWSSKDSMCSCTRMLLSRPSSATTPSWESTEPTSASSMVRLRPMETSPRPRTEASRSVSEPARVSSEATCTSGGASGNAATSTCSCRASSASAPAAAAAAEAAGLGTLGPPGPGMAAGGGGSAST
mmetsp:Transcript_104797/g.323207  ORF Transcript_104797/g.323207 Transcript_104797/m.323207 type:complete len:219 (+) Transcript_104797:726-1382(+)